MRRFAPPVPRRWWLLLCLAAVLASAGTLAAQQQAPRPIADPNVNMVRGITWPDGDPYMQRQNEPSIAISTRNPCHLVAGANDYRTVDIPFDDTVPPNSEPSLSLAGDAWLGLFKSFDCGQKWSSTMLPGYPQDSSGQAPELEGYAAGADPTVRAGTNGLFYYSGMVFNRGDQGDSKIFVARLVDNNNQERGDPIEFLDVATIDIGTKGQFLDKPWLAVDVPRNGFGPGSTLATGNTSSTGSCVVNGQQVPAGNVYMAWARFTGDSDQHSKLMFARSEDCGLTWKSNPISNNQTISQGANIAVAPHDGTIYLTWREFASSSNGNGNGNGAKPVNFWVAVSSDGGKTFSAPKKIANNVTTFDQPRSESTFRSNALPAITADHENRVYIAWSARGYAPSCTLPSGNVTQTTQDARIVMTVSSDRGKTFGPIFPIDPSPKCGHQMMPQLTFAAGKIQAIYYDAREDAAGVFSYYIDDSQATGLRHTIDVRGAQAAPASSPVFVAANGESLEISRYRQWQVGPPDNRTSMEVGSNPPNLAMYAQGTTPFIGDYIDVSGLSSFPIQTSNGQVWQPNIGPVNLMGPSANNISTGGFPTLPIFHATWTDNRDVKIAPQCVADPNTGQPVEQLLGQRNANIYTARLTSGLFVGSTGNTKPLGFRVDPETNQPTTELIQRGFVVFAQNTTDTLKFFEFRIANQPANGHATFRQFEKPGTPPRDVVVVAIPRRSTVARTLYATSTDPVAQILVNVQEVTPIEVPGTAGDGGGQLRKEYQWPPLPGGLRGSVLLNPDRSNPKILDPDVDSDVPQIASDEIHDPSMFEAQFFRFKPGTVSRKLDVKNPDPENPDPENPDPENPDPENPDPENPDPENPDPENPDPENPDPENPDPENPDPENPDVENTAISDAELASAAITDINWRVHNSGNTTSSYRFRPSLPRKFDNQKYQLIVTKRYMVLTTDPVTCQPIYKSYNQVLTNIQNYKPRTPDPENPDPENPDPENPDPENPDPENPDPENPDPENPDPENPDPENANFFLAPDETATVTLRVFDLEPTDNEPAPTTENDVAGKTAAEAANTGETEVTTAVAGPDLTLDDVPPAIVPAIIRPGVTVNVTWTLTNRGTASAIVAPPNAIRTNVYFSADAVLDPLDLKIGATIEEPSPFVHCPDATADETCSTATTTALNLAALPPQFQAPGQYYLIVVTDDDNDADDPAGEVADPDRVVFEADELNNVLVVPIKVDAYQLTFTQQPSSTTQDFTMTPAVTVAVTHPDGSGVGAAEVPFVTLAIQNNPGGGLLSGTVARPNVGGVASFTDLRIDVAGNGYTLSATAPSSTGVVSAPFNIEADLPPVVVNDSYTTSEDQALNVPAPGVLTNDSDPPTKGIEPPAYSFDAVVAAGPANGVLNLALDGSFTYAPNAAFAGVDTFTYRARDGRAGNETLGTVTITVTSSNDPPSFTKGPDQTVAEDAGPQVVPNWATAISPGPANESGQTVTFLVDNNSNSLFSSQPAVSPDGTLTYTPAANASGAATVTVRLQDNGGTAGGGSDTSAPQMFSITVTAVGDAPVAVADNYTTTEDTPFGMDAGSGDPALLFNDSDPDPGTVLVAEYLSTTTNGTLLPHQNGSFSYTPNPNFFGTDSFTYRAIDNQNNPSNIVTVTITVLARNDAPSFTKGADQTAPSGNVRQTVPGWATAISAGPANESAQAVDFIVTNDNNGLFNEQPSVSPAGVLAFTPRQNQTGTATVTVRIHDDGGTANGGIDTSAPQAFLITVSSAGQNFVVTNTNDSGNGSLRAAITNANANSSADVISFDIPGGGVRTIAPVTPLPAIVFPVVINATTQPGYAGTPLVELNGSSAGAGANGLSVTASSVTIRGFIINRFQGAGISLNGANNLVAGNYIGTNAAGNGPSPNGMDGIWIGGSPNTIGGSAAAERNVVSGNQRRGITVQNANAAGTAIKGNYIGTNAAGNGPVPNAQAGVWIEQSNTVQVGGDGPGEGNIISGNNGDGVQLYVCDVGLPCNGHLVAGNRIGTNAAGGAAIPNKHNGVHVTRTPKNTIRGNLISGNGDAGDPFSGWGIAIETSNLIDDPLAELHHGDQTVTGNLIGTNAAGTAGIPNLRYGIVLNGYTKTRIGGPAAADRNVIAYNGGAGIFVGWQTSPNNVIQGNYIGVNATGTQAAGNGQGGIFVRNGSTGNLIAANVIGANAGAGISFGDGQNNANTIQGNTIGLDQGGTVALGNQGPGIALDGSNNVVSFNRIANNTGAGIGLFAATGAGNRLSQNQIHDNGALGIDLGAAGVNANDAGDGDAGVNNLQNYPVLSLAHTNGAAVTVTGTLNSAAGTAFTIEFFSNPAADPSGNGEGKLYIGSLNVVTDGSGNAAIATVLPPVAAGGFITATATDPAGNTSEFSPARVVVANLPPTATDDDLTAYSGTSSTTYPSANDTDPDVAAPSLLATVRGMPVGAPVLTLPGDVAVVNATGLAYFTGGSGTAAVQPSVGIFDTDAGTITGTLTTRVPGTSSLVRVNQATQIAYMRAGNTLQAVDGRSASPTFNQVILSLSPGAIQSMAIDETRGRLYVTATTSGAATLIQGRVFVIDVDPSSPTFHQVVGEVVAPGSATAFGTAGSIGVNAVTNKIYVAFNGGTSPGVNVIDGATLAVTQVANTGGASTLVVNSANNMVYATQGANLFAIDGVTNTRIAAIALPAVAVSGPIDTRLALHRGAGRVYVRLAEFPAPSRLVVVDGDRNSPSFNTILTSIALGRENGSTMVAVDEAVDRLITTSRSDLETAIIDTTDNSVVGTVTATQLMTRIAIDTAHHRAYLVGGIGYILSVDLVAGSEHAIIPTGVENTFAAANPLNGSAYVTETGLTTTLKRVDASGLLGTVPQPHGDGRQLVVVRNGVTNRFYALNTAADADGGDDALPGFVSVIDGASNTTIANVPVGPLPFQGIAVNEATNRIYVGGSSSGVAFPGNITVINGVDHSTALADTSQIPRTSPISQLSFARDLVVNPVTNKVYVRIAGGSTATMGVLNGATNVVTPLPDMFGAISVHRVNPLLNRVYIGGTDAAGEHQLYVLDGSNDQLLATIQAGSPSPFSVIQSHLAINRTTGRVYLADYDQNTLTVIDGATNAIVATVPVGRGPTSVAVNETMNRIYVASPWDRTLMIVDGVSNRVVRTVALPLMPYRLDVDESASLIFVVAALAEPGVMVVSDPGTSAPTVLSVTQGANGTVVLNADGSITYTPTGPFTGPDSYTYTVVDSQGAPSTATVTVNVVPALAITTASLPPTTVGSGYAQAITTAGGTGARSWLVAAGTLPGGLALNSSTGQLSGTARQSGTFGFTIQVSDSGDPRQSTAADYEIVVGPPVITTTGLANADLNVPYSEVLVVGGATGAVSWTLNTNNNPLLGWLSLSADGTLSGTPNEPGPMPSFIVTATDSLNQVASRSLSLFVSGPLDTAPLREGVVLESQPSLSFTGGAGSRTATVTAGSLPPGLTLGSSGSFSGTPLRHGEFNFTLELKDCQLSNGLPTCTNQSTPQVVSKDVTLRVSARDQTGSSGANGSIPFGGAGGRRLAQVITVGAHGTLTAVGLNGASCPTVTPVLVEVQRLTLAGLPDGVTISDGVATTNYNAILVTPAIPVAIDERLAFVISSPVACTMTNTSTSDFYNGGDAYVDAGGGWQTLFSTDGRYDVPSVRSLIQPAMDVAYMLRGRGAHTATLLDNGTVLLAGNNVASEIYDPATHASVLTTGQVATSRTNHTATLLADGKVLLVGGQTPAGPRTPTAELYDPATGLFTTLAGQLALARDRHRAVRLNDGRVLIIGGQTDVVGRTATAEIYDPVTQTFSATGSMSTGREWHTATLLQSGKVLVTGGYTNCCGSSAEVFDPATGTFSPTTGAMVVGGRGVATATLLDDGRVLVAGGQSGDVRNDAELYDPATGTFSATGPMASKRYWHTATLLADGSVLMAGGYDQQSQNSYIFPLASLERYVPASGTFVPAGGMETRRQSHAAVRLANDKVLLSGGFFQGWMTGNTSELYDPSTALTLSPTTLPTAPPGVPFSAVFTATGGVGPYQIAHVSGALPPGMAFDQNTATLAGTPGVAGAFVLGLMATDSAGHSVVQSVQFNTIPVFTITSTYPLVSGAVGAYYEVQLTAVGPAPITWSVAPASSQLPPGLSLGTNGVLSGTPTATGYYNFVVRAVDNLGRTAIKALAISINSPLSITTTSLSNIELFGGGPCCINAANGVGTRTFSIAAGALPAGLTLTSSGNFSGTAMATGQFSFTLQVTDQASPPQVATRPLTFNVWASDQGTGWSANGPDLTFGGATGRRLGQRVITGLTGTLRAVRLNGVICPAGTVVTASVQGLTPAGAPDGNTVTSASGAPFLSIEFNGGGEFFAADAQFAVMFDADQACAVKPNAFDSYPGDGFVSEGGGNWETLLSFDGRYDIPFQTLIDPEPGFTYLREYRGNHTETLLGNGKVLIAGGTPNTMAELFDPATNATTAIASAMTSSRYGHAATLLANGKVLLTGGTNQAGANVGSAEIYDPALNTFTATGSMISARSGHTATLLGNGKVLVAGGYAGNGQSWQTAELYDPASGTFAALPNMMWQRNEHTATLLGDGRVLLAAGYGAGSNAELFDPITQTFTATDQPMLVSRGRHTATLLASGKVLIAGGTGNNGVAESSAEIFDPAAGPFGNGLFQATTSGMQMPRVDHAAVALSDGSVLISGGLIDYACCYPHPPVAAMERYIPGLNAFEGAGTMLASRYSHAAVALPGDKVLYSGTWGWSSAAGRTAEVYDFGATPRFESTNAGRAESGQPYSLTLFPTGGAGAPYTAAIVSGSLPGGIAFNAGTMTFSGIATESGAFPLTVSLSDGMGRTSYHAITLRFDTLLITTAAPLPTAYLGVDYLGVGFSADGLGAVTWQIISGSLPPGLSLNPVNGAVTGTPAGLGWYSFTVKATDAEGQTATQATSISVQQPIQITTTTLGDGTAGETYYGCLNANGGNGNRTWSLSGQVPIGLQIQNNGCFDTTYPAQVLRQGGTFTFTAQVADSSVPQQIDTQQFTIRVQAVDQSPSSQWGAVDVPMPDTRRVAQVYRSSSPFPLSGLQLYGNLTCDPGVQVTVNVWPVTGTPARPLETVSLGVAQITADPFGNLWGNLTFSPSVAMPQGSRFAVTVEANGACTVKNMSDWNYYQGGDAWVDDGGGWTLARTTIGREDLPFATLVLPPASQRFFSSWRGNGTSITLANGRVLIVGPDNTAEIYDPAANTIALTGSMATPRQNATATLLSNGKVLVVGGEGWVNNLHVVHATSEIFDPASGTFSAGPVMTTGRYNHAATTLDSGAVLVTGGQNDSTQATDSAVVFDSAGATIQEFTMTGARAEHTATLLGDGRVLILGGWTADPWPSTVAEIFDPGDNSFTAVAAGMSRWPSQHTATRLTTGPNAGKVLIAGGAGSYPFLPTSSDLFDPVSETFSAAPGMLVPRIEHRATMLSDGRIAFTGGADDWLNWVATSQVEIYDPVANQFTPAGHLITDRANHGVSTITVSGQERLAVAAGWGTGGLSNRTIEVVDPAGASAALGITTVSLPDGQTGQEYGLVLLNAAGGTPPYDWFLAWGSLPPGVFLGINGEFNGVPAATGVYSFVLGITDAASNTATRAFTIVIDRLTITSGPNLPDATQNAFYSHQLTASGGTGAVTWTAWSGLPDGLTLTPGGLLSGTPTGCCFYQLTVKATDSVGQSAIKNLFLTIVP